MSHLDQSQTGLNILCIDGGGVRGLSALVLLEEVMHRIQHLEGLDSPPEPYKYFDLIAGSGTGAIQACMLGRLRMPVRSAIESYETLVKEVFSDRKWVGSGSFKTTKLKDSIRKLVQRVTGDPDKPMQESSLDTQCKTLVYAMPSQTVRGNIPIAFRSYPAGALEGPKCTIWETLCATMVHPALFKRFEIDGPPKWTFTGADLACNNPLVYVLNELKTAYRNRHVAVVLSLGTGQSDTIPVSKTYGIRRSLPKAAIMTMRSIAANTESVAEGIALRFSSTQDTYFRLNVDQGIQSVGIEKWEQLSEVVEHTRAYMRLINTSQVIDQAAMAVLTRSLGVPTEQIDGTIQVSRSYQGLATTDGSCPDPTPAFTGRQDMREVVKLCILGRDTRERIICVVYGLGGAGKTQLALKVVESTRRHWAEVIYIDASTRDSIEDGLRGVSVARKLGDTFNDALRWLESRQERWLLVLDNADDQDIRLRDYFPTGNHGSIIITTRLYGMTALAQGPNSICHVSNLSPDDALALLLKAARKQEGSLSTEETKSATAIVEDVGRFALAIVHAGAFIEQSQHMTFTSYRSMYRDRKRQVLEAYSELPPAAKLDSYGHTVYTTWVMCYEKLGPEAQNLLWLIAYMHHSGITVDIFRRAAVKIGSYRPVLPTTALEDSALDQVWRFLGMFIDSSQSWNDLAFTKVVNEIASHSLLEYDHTLQAYRIHVLVQSWAGTVVPHASNLAAYQTRILLALAIPYDDDTVSILFRQSVGLHIDKVDSEPVEKGALIHVEAFCEVFRERGQEAKAEPLQRQICEVSKQVLGDRDLHTLNRMNDLARTYKDLGRSEEARALCVQVFDTRKQVQGERHPDTLSSMNNLSIVYRELGRPEKAQPLLVQVLNTLKQVQGDRHPDTLKCMSRLAETYRDLGKPEEARALNVQALDAWKQVLGDSHPKTFASTERLALIYDSLGQPQKARALYTQALDAYKQVLGERHPDALKCMIRLAATYRHVGQLEEALVLCVQALDLCKQVLGDRHRDTLSSMASLALTYSNLGQPEEARALHTQVLNVRKQALGDRHPETLSSMASLALTYSSLGQPEEARALHVQVLDVRKQALGDRHPKTLLSMEDLALTYSSLGKPEEARALHVQVLDVRKQALGDRHPDTLSSMFQLARAYNDLGQLEEAQTLKLQVLDARKQALGNRDRRTIESMIDLAFTHFNLGQYSEAQVLFAELFSVSKNIYGLRHRATLGSMAKLAEMYLKLGAWDQADKLQIDLEVYAQVFGESHHATKFAQRIYKDIQRCLAEQGEHSREVSAESRSLEDSDVPTYLA